MKQEDNGTVKKLGLGFKIASDLVRRKVLNRILIEFGTPLKLVRLIKFGLNGACVEVSRGK
jgi:hypothetical protein